MSADKKVRLEFVVDQTSLNSVTRAFEQVAEAAARAANAMGNGGGGLLTGVAGSNMPGTGSMMNKAAGGGAGGGPDTRTQLTKYVQDNLDALKKIGEGNKDVARIVTEAMHNSFVSQINDLKELNKQAEEYRKNLTTLMGEKARFQALPDGHPSKRLVLSQLEGHIAGAELGTVQTAAKQQNANANLANALGGPAANDNPAAGGAPPQGPGGPGTGLFARFSGFMGGFKGMLGAGGAIGATVLAGNSVLNEMQALGSEDVVNRARRVGSVQSMFNRIVGNDLKPLVALEMLRQGGASGNEANRLAMDDYLSMDQSVTASLGGVRQGLGQAASHLLSPVPGGSKIGGWLFGGVQDRGGTAFNALRGSQLETLRAENLMGQADMEARALSPRRQLALDQFSGQLSSRIALGRILGTGLHYNPKAPEEFQWTDTHGRLVSNLQKSGYNEGEYASAYAGMMNMVGRKAAGTHAGSAMSAAAAGYGGWDSLLGSSERSGSGASFAQAAIGGNIDAAAGIQLGNVILGDGFNARGQTGGFGTLGAFQHMFDGTSADFNRVRAVQGGIALGSSLTMGSFDPWQKSQNLINAVQANPGLGLYGQDYLANGMEFGQMVDIAYGGGKLTKTAQAMGVTRGMVRDQMNSSVSSFMDRFYGSDTSTPMGKYATMFRDSGMDMSGWLKSLKGKERREAIDSIGSFYGYESGMGEEYGVALMEGMAGLGNKTKSKKGLGGGMGEGERAIQEKLSKETLATTKALEGMGGAIKTTATFSEQATEALNTFASDLTVTSARVAVELAGLGEAVAGLRDVILGNPTARAKNLLLMAEQRKAPKADAPKRQQGAIPVAGPGKVM